MYVFWKQPVTSLQRRRFRISRRMRVPPSNPRVVTPAWWYIFVECVSSIKRIVCCLFVLFSIFILLSRESDAVMLYFGRIRTRFRVVHFRVFRFFDFLPLDLLLVRSHQAEIIIVKCLIQMQRVRWGWKLNLVHVIVITRSP